MDGTCRDFAEYAKRYERDVKLFLDFLGERKITPKILNEYKSLKLEEYRAAAVKM